MYIIEQIIKLFKKNNDEYSENRYIREEDLPEDYMKCRHTFMPIDSTGKIFACSKCGYMTTENILKRNKKKK